LSFSTVLAEGGEAAHARVKAGKRQRRSEGLRLGSETDGTSRARKQSAVRPARHKFIAHGNGLAVNSKLPARESHRR